MMIHEKTFAGLSVRTVADWLQLPPFREKFKDNMKYLLGLHLWNL